MFLRLNIDVGGWGLLQKLPLNFTESAIYSLLELYPTKKISPWLWTNEVGSLPMRRA